MQRACSCGQASPNLFAVLRHACMRMQQSGSSLHDAAACSSPPAVAWSLIQQPPPLPRARPTEHRLVSAAGDHPGSGYPLFSCSIQRTWPPATRASGCGEGPALDWFVWFDWLIDWLSTPCQAINHCLIATVSRHWLFRARAQHTHLIGGGMDNLNAAAAAAACQ